MGQCPVFSYTQTNHIGFTSHCQESKVSHLGSMVFLAVNGERKFFCVKLLLYRGLVLAIN